MWCKSPRVDLLLGLRQSDIPIFCRFFDSHDMVDLIGMFGAVQITRSRWVGAVGCNCLGYLLRVYRRELIRYFTQLAGQHLV